MKDQFELYKDVKFALRNCCLSDHHDPCSVCPYRNKGCDNEMGAAALRAIEDLETIIAEAKIVPTLEEAQEYLRTQGYPEADFADTFCSLTVKRRSQYWECVRNGYDLPDFDRWQRFQNAIKGTISWEDFCKISNILCEYDIEIMEMDTKEKSLYGS